MNLSEVWVKFFNEQFAPLNAEKAAMWQNELQREYSGIDDGEVVRAIRSMTEDSKCPQEFPKIKNLLFHIRTNRRKKTHENIDHAEACTNCWPYAPGNTYQQVRTAKYPEPFLLFNPCACILGQREAWKWGKESDRDAREVFEFLNHRAIQIRNHRAAGFTEDDPLALTA